MDEEGRLVREHSFPATKKAVEKFTTGIPSSQMAIAIEACGIWEEHTISSGNLARKRDSKQREEQ